MRLAFRPWLLLVAGLSVAAGSWVLAQQGPTPVLPQAPQNPPPAGAGQAQSATPKELPPPPPAGAVAATVNTQPIPEIAVYRAVIRGDGKNPAEIRKEVLNFLIDTTLVDQYLVALKVEVEKKDIDDRIETMKKEAADQKEDFDKILKSLYLTMDELRYQITGAIRWENFVNKQATEKVLKDFFEKNQNMFDGSQVHARHILITPGEGVQAHEEAKAKAAALKKQIEAQVAQELAQVPPQADNLTREKK